MRFKNVLKTLLENRKSIIFILLVVTLAFWLGSKIPQRKKDIQAHRLNIAIETLKQTELDNKALRTEYQAEMDKAHNENKEIRAIIEAKQKDLCEIDEKYCIEIEIVEAVEIKRTYDYIIIHHTATRSDISIEDMKTSMIKTHWIIPAHYIIAKDWTREKTAELKDNVWSTMNHEYNMAAIQIEMIWNFNDNPPTERQYKTLKYITDEIYKKYWNLRTIRHMDVPNSPTWCPWKLFDIKKIQELPKIVYDIDWSILLVKEENDTRTFKERFIRYAAKHLTFDVDMWCAMCEIYVSDNMPDSDPHIRGNYAYDKWENIEFVKSLNRENPLWTTDKQSDVQQDYGREMSYWICQLHVPIGDYPSEAYPKWKWHYPFVNSKFFNDPKLQIDYCWDVRLDWEKQLETNPNKKNPFHAYEWISGDNRVWYYK